MSKQYHHTAQIRLHRVDAAERLAFCASIPARQAELRHWRRVACTGSIPGPRSGAASVVVDDRMYLFGGYGGLGRLQDFFEFDFGKASRESEADHAKASRTSCRACACCSETGVEGDTVHW